MARREAVVSRIINYHYLLKLIGAAPRAIGAGVSVGELFLSRRVGEVLAA